MAILDDWSRCGFAQFKLRADFLDLRLSSDLPEVFNFLVDDAILVMPLAVISVSTSLDKYAIALRLRQFPVSE
jgi:hypothetical protein